MKEGPPEAHSMLVQRAGRVMVDSPAAAAEDASLTILRWCRFRDCRRATLGHPCYCHRCCCRSRQSYYSCLFPFPCPYPYLSRYCWGWGQEGEEPSQDTSVPAVVGTEAVATAEGALHLRAWSKTQRPIPGPPSGPARSPRVRGCCGRCGRRETTAIA
jgi:hypothetical protein